MWEQSRWIIVGGGLLVLLQALFVITKLPSVKAKSGSGSWPIRRPC
jgi:hypothetical protein